MNIVETDIAAEQPITVPLRPDIIIRNRAQIMAGLRRAKRITAQIKKEQDDVERQRRIEQEFDQLFMPFGAYAKLRVKQYFSNSRYFNDMASFYSPLNASSNPWLILPKTIYWTVANVGGAIQGVSYTVFKNPLALEAYKKLKVGLLITDLSAFPRLEMAWNKRAKIVNNRRKQDIILRRQERVQRQQEHMERLLDAEYGERTIPLNKAEPKKLGIGGRLRLFALSAIHHRHRHAYISKHRRLIGVGGAVGSAGYLYAIKSPTFMWAGAKVTAAAVQGATVAAPVFSAIGTTLGLAGGVAIAAGGGVAAVAAGATAYASYRFGKKVFTPERRTKIAKGISATITPLSIWRHKGKIALTAAAFTALSVSWTGIPLAIAAGVAAKAARNKGSNYYANLVAQSAAEPENHRLRAKIALIDNLSELGRNTLKMPVALTLLASDVLLQPIHKLIHDSYDGMEKYPVTRRLTKYVGRVKSPWAIFGFSWGVVPASMAPMAHKALDGAIEGWKFLGELREEGAELLKKVSAGEMDLSEFSDFRARTRSVRNAAWQKIIAGGFSAMGVKLAITLIGGKVADLGRKTVREKSPILREADKAFVGVVEWAYDVTADFRSSLDRTVRAFREFFSESSNLAKTVGQETLLARHDVKKVVVGAAATVAPVVIPSPILKAVTAPRAVTPAERKPRRIPARDRATLGSRASMDDIRRIAEERYGAPVRSDMPLPEAPANDRKLG